MKARFQCRRLGFSLIELLVAIVVLSIVLVITVPTFKGIVSASKMTSATNTILGHMQYARSEAVKRGATVGIGPYATDTTWATGQS